MLCSLRPAPPLTASRATRWSRCASFVTIGTSRCSPNAKARCMPARGEVLQLDTMDAGGEMSRPSTLWRVVSVTVHVPSLASTSPRDGSPLAVKLVEVARAARHRARARVRGGGRADPVRIEDVTMVPNRSTMTDIRTRACTASRRSCRRICATGSFRPGWSWGAEGLNTQHRHYQESSTRSAGRCRSSARRTRRTTTGSRRRRGIWRIATTRRCRRRTTTGRRSPRAVAVRAICDAGSPAKRSARDCAAWAPTTCPACSDCMREIGSALSYLHDLGDRARMYVAGHRVDDADGPTVDHRLAVGDAGERDSRRARARLPLHAGAARVGGRGVASDAARAISGSSRRSAFSMLTGETPPSDEVPPLTLLRPDCPQAVATVIDRALRA